KTMWDSVVDPSAIKEISAKFAVHYGCMPVGWENGTLKIVMASEPDIATLDEMRVVFRKDIRVVLASEEELEKAMKMHYGIGAETLEKLASDSAIETKAVKTPGTDLDAAQEASIAKFVNQ